MSLSQQDLIPYSITEVALGEQPSTQQQEEQGGEVVTILQQVVTKGVWPLFYYPWSLDERLSLIAEHLRNLGLVITSGYLDLGAIIEVGNQREWWYGTDYTTMEAWAIQGIGIESGIIEHARLFYKQSVFLVEKARVDINAPGIINALTKDKLHYIAHIQKVTERERKMTVEQIMGDTTRTPDEKHALIEQLDEVQQANIQAEVSEILPLAEEHFTSYRRKHLGERLMRPLALSVTNFDQRSGTFTIQATWSLDDLQSVEDRSYYPLFTYQQIDYLARDLMKKFFGKVK